MFLFSVSDILFPQTYLKHTKGLMHLQKVKAAGKSLCLLSHASIEHLGKVNCKLKKSLVSSHHNAGCCHLGEKFLMMT